MRKNHGIYPMFSILNLFQLPLHFVYISLINKLAYDFTICPAILTDGILWFTDLSSPDPTGILPLIGGVFSLLNIMSTAGNNSSQMMKKFSKLLRILPLISVPIWMTFPAAFNVYWLVTSGSQLFLTNVLRFRGARYYFGINDFLQGSKLESMNTKRTMAVRGISKPKILKHNPTIKKIKQVKSKKGF